MRSILMWRVCGTHSKGTCIRWPSSLYERWENFKKSFSCLCSTPTNSRSPVPRSSPPPRFSGRLSWLRLPHVSGCSPPAPRHLHAACTAVPIIGRAADCGRMGDTWGVRTWLNDLPRTAVFNDPFCFRWWEREKNLLLFAGSHTLG